MRKQIVYIIIVATLQTLLVCAVNAQTLTINTDPPGLDVWVGNELIGKAPVQVEGPFEDRFIVSVKVRDAIFETTVDVPITEDTDMMINANVKHKSSGGGTFLSGVLGAVLGAVVTSAILAIILSTIRW